MSSLYNQLIAILSRYMAATNAHSVLERAVRRAVRQADVNPEHLQPRDHEVIAPTLEQGIRVFVEESLRGQLALSDRYHGGPRR